MRRGYPGIRPTKHHFPREFDRTLWHRDVTLDSLVWDSLRHYVWPEILYRLKVCSILKAPPGNFWHTLVTHGQGILKTPKFRKRLISGGNPPLALSEGNIDSRKISYNTSTMKICRGKCRFCHWTGKRDNAGHEAMAINKTGIIVSYIFLLVFMVSFIQNSCKRIGDCSSGAYTSLSRASLVVAGIKQLD